MDLAPGVVTLVGTQVVILLRFDALQEDRILLSCAVKITHTVTEFSPIEYLLTRDRFSWGKVVINGDLMVLYKRVLRSQVKVRNSEYAF